MFSITKETPIGQLCPKVGQCDLQYHPNHPSQEAINLIIGNTGITWLTTLAIDCTSAIEVMQQTSHEEYGDSPE